MNFTLPNQIIIQNVSISLITIFIGLSILSWFFNMWYEGRRDGFDEERLLDLSFVSIFISCLVGLGLYKYISWLEIYRPYNFILGLDKWLILGFGMFFSGLLPLVVFCHRWSWSLYRLLDIYISAFSQFGFILSIGVYYIYKIPVVVPFMIISPLIYILVLRLRSIQFLSGLVFSSFLFLMIPYIVLFYRPSGYLFFCFVLATIGIINFYLRWRKNYAGTTSFGRIYKTSKSKTIRKGTRTK